MRALAFVLVLCSGLFGASAALAAECASGQNPWVAGGNSAWSGSTELAACQAWAAANGLTDLDIAEGGACRAYDAQSEAVTTTTAQVCEPPAGGTSGQVTVCEGTCTVTHVVSIEGVGLTGDKVADYMELWMAFVGFCVVVLVLKSIYSRFRMDSAG